ncbi:hypothetical protein GCM10009557_53620 [Virgisporangium ochraceum]|uniref:Barstar (barnase inhibitor) domain-containing protein n=1 Tax=Virgisporangium ochraceum TaxID=65505 RepID=A0A8J3ZRK6_9ACTN|nr:barstar family protein [Virgisporangium ochraceum]GIJ66668.1 hypothetical protein Voc01_015850 [Virgisporangium ochraceum]
MRRWAWDHAEAPRWLLTGDLGAGRFFEGDVSLGLCLDIEGLFVDLPPRARERFTLVGCVPEGPLAVDGWLGDLVVGDPSVFAGEVLADVTVLGRRPSATVPGTVDLDLDGFLVVDDRTDAVARPSGIPRFALLAPDDTPYGTCHDVTGVFREQAPAPVPTVRLLGCRPEPHLRKAIDGVSPHRRYLRAEVHLVAGDGSANRVIDAEVAGTVVAAGPSGAGAGLLDVTVHSVPREPLPAGLAGILDRWRAGRPTEPNLWAGYDRNLRHHWAGVALGHWTGGTDRPPGTTYDLDGRYVTDVEGFYCALGEAVDGPGGYFGWNLDALDDCLGGDPFTLVWHDSAVARAHLVDGYDRRRLGPAVTLDALLGLFAEHGVTVSLR